MKIAISCLWVVILPFFVSTAGAEALFEYPQVPDRLTKANMRFNFMVEHLWDGCNLEKEEITDIESFRETFNDYLSFFVLADIPVIEKSVKKFVERVSKNKANLQTVIDFTDSEIFRPTAPHCNDDVYTMFAKNLAANKKVDVNVRQRMETNMQIVANSRIETVMGDMVLSDGEGTLHGLQSQYTIVFFNRADCTDCSIYKLRLSTDVATNNLIKSGAVNIVSVYPSAMPDCDAKMAEEQENWRTAKLDDMEEKYDMRIQPCVYILGADKKIIVKSPGITQLLSLMAQLGNAMGV